MWSTLSSIFKGRAARAESALIDANAVVILEQKVQEAEAGHQAAKRTLAQLIVREKNETRALNAVRERARDLENRIRAAMKADKQQLARDAATLLAEIENEAQMRQDCLTRMQEKSDRLRLAIEKTQRRLIDLRQGLTSARSIEQERTAMKGLKGSISSTASLKEGEDMLKRILESEDPVEHIETMETIDSELNGNALMDRLTDAGFGSSPKVRADDILERLSETPAEEIAS